jgi:hypothetical protein
MLLIMKLHELKSILARHPVAELRFYLPGGESAPLHSHITEVARMDKRFIDCGGTLRTESFCRLQVWSAQDLDHRLTAGKLAAIFAKAENVLQTDALEVDVEYEAGFVSQFPLERLEILSNAIVFHLGMRHTACLAEDKCGIPPAKFSATNPLKFNFREIKTASKCCS